MHGGIHRHRAACREIVPQCIRHGVIDEVGRAVTERRIVIDLVSSAGIRIEPVAPVVIGYIASNDVVAAGAKLEAIAVAAPHSRMVNNVSFDDVPRVFPCVDAIIGTVIDDVVAEGMAASGIPLQADTIGISTRSRRIAPVVNIMYYGILNNSIPCGKEEDTTHIRVMHMHVVEYGVSTTDPDAIAGGICDLDTLNGYIASPNSEDWWIIPWIIRVRRLAGPIDNNPFTWSGHECNSA